MFNDANLLIYVVDCGAIVRRAMVREEALWIL